MRIYFAGAISGGRDDVCTYGQIVTYLKSRGHSVPSEHVANPLVLEEEGDLEPRVVYERDVAWIGECHAMIAEVSCPSLGVGYEVASALCRGKPVLCLYREGLSISKMITGNSSASLRVAAYRDSIEMVRHIDAFLRQV